MLTEMFKKKKWSIKEISVCVHVCSLIPPANLGQSARQFNHLTQCKATKQQKKKKKQNIQLHLVLS